jgi:hypothetical protein
MERSGWVQAKAARMLGLTPRQMGYALRKYSIEIKRLLTFSGSIRFDAVPCCQNPRAPADQISNSHSAVSWPI